MVICDVINLNEFFFSPTVVPVTEFRFECVCVVVRWQTLDGDDGRRSHGHRPTAASTGAGFFDLRGKSGLFERTKHGAADVPAQTARQPCGQLQVNGC